MLCITWDNISHYLSNYLHYLAIYLPIWWILMVQMIQGLTLPYICTGCSPSLSFSPSIYKYIYFMSFLLTSTPKATNYMPAVLFDRREDVSSTTFPFKFIYIYIYIELQGVCFIYIYTNTWWSFHTYIYRVFVLYIFKEIRGDFLFVHLQSFSWFIYYLYIYKRIHDFRLYIPIQSVCLFISIYWACSRYIFINVYRVFVYLYPYTGPVRVIYL